MDWLNIRRHRAVAIEMMGDLKTAESELAYIVEECTKQFGVATPLRCPCATNEREWHHREGS